MNKCCAAAFSLMLAAASAVSAQDAPSGQMGEFDMIAVKAGVLDSPLDGRFETLSQGVQIELYSSTDPTKRLPVSANEIKFQWSEAKDLAGMLLTGKVVVDHPQANIRSDKAEWDMVKGLLTFIGDPILRAGDGQEMSSQRVVINTTDNTMQAYGIVIPEWKLGGSGFGGAAAAADPSLLTQQDILDWPGLISSIREQAAVEDSPGKQVVSQLDQSARKMIVSVPVETLLENKESLLKQINKVVASPGLYKKAAWEGKEIDKETQELLAQEGLAGEKLLRANRGLLEAAYPGMITPRPDRGQ